MSLAFQQGMEFRWPLRLTSTMAVLSILCVQTLGAHTPINVDVDRSADKAYVVDAAFDVNVPAPIAWEVLTDYEGIGLFVSSIRHSTIKEREPGRVLLEQHGVGRAWIISLPMHVVLDVREHGRRVLAFRDVCGKSFSTYEGAWELSTIAGGTRVTYRLKADPNGRQPAMLAKSAIRGSVRQLLDEVREEMLARGAR
ncbi:MAG TPA: SRPBCC family protein [Vicinamibacterales bacterium]|nr:SRPBCC family protein [Vicinamibacterales bacterium]